MRRSPCVPAHPALRLIGVRKIFGKVEAVQGVDLEVAHGEIVGMLGPSGCGKTTVLRCIAGLERLDGGTVEIDGVFVAGPSLHVPAERRRVGMVFQDYALFPHLSGGQQQRVALARALAPRPNVILLDEPFSNLDAALRTTVREDVRRILKAAQTTAVFVTHDQEEALSLADEVAVMLDGRIHQTDRPHVLYTRPSTPWVARFVGDADVLPGTRTADGQVATGLGVHQPVEPLVSDRADVVVRPEAVRLTADAHARHTIESITYFGHDQLVRIRLADGTVVRSRQGPELLLRAGDTVSAEVVGPVVTYPSTPSAPCSLI